MLLIQFVIVKEYGDSSRLIDRINSQVCYTGGLLIISLALILKLHVLRIHWHVAFLFDYGEKGLLEKLGLLRGNFGQVFQDDNF